MPATKFPIIEIFGPVLQGEGMMIGKQTMFCRFGGCDFRCVKCDTMIAVDPTEIRKRATHMEAEEIFLVVEDLSYHTEWITYSGGNPLLWELGDLTDMFHHADKRIAVETQGSLYKPWVNSCDCITVSPKGPGMGEMCNLGELDVWASKLRGHPGFNLKVVVFGDPDIEFAVNIHNRYPEVPFYISLGNPYLPGEFTGTAGRLIQLEGLLTSMVWLEKKVTSIPDLREAIVLPQMHVLMHGNKEGV